MISRVTGTIFSDKHGTTIPRNSGNPEDAKRQSVQRGETSTSCEGLCCSFTSPWNHLDVWHFKHDQRESRISIHLHHSQLITGNLLIVELSVAFVAEAQIASIVISVRALTNLPFVRTSQPHRPFCKWNPSVLPN